VCMRTTLDLDPVRIREVMRLAGATTKTEAIHLALDAYVQRRRLERLLGLAGRIHYDLDWQKLEEAELGEANRRPARRHR